jgi:hypothetical protein
LYNSVLGSAAFVLASLEYERLYFAGLHDARLLR